ncbi:MAG: PAS domain S-box protein [Clostridiales bacterium]
MSEQRLNSLVNVLQFQCNSIQAYLDYALNESIKLTQSKIGYIYYYDEVKKEFTLNTWSKDVMKECSTRNPGTKYKLEFTGIWGEAVRQGKPIIVNDFKMPNDLKKGYPDGHVQISKFMTIPIINDNKIAGVVGLANKESDYTQTDVLQLTFLMDAVWKVTEKKKAEMAFKESEEKYKMVFNASPDSFSISRMDGRYVDVNEGFLRLTGFTREEVIGASISEIQKLDIPGDRNDFNSSLQENGLVENLESAFRCKNGEVKTVLVSARIINIDNEPHILSITKDISYKKGIENDLKKAKELYLKIFDDFPALIWRAGTDKLCNYFNRTWLEFTGRTFEQENGNGWAEGVHPDDFSSCVDTYINAFDKREAFSMEYRLKNSSGEYRWLRDFGRPFFDLDNSFLGYIGSCYDITVNKQNGELIIESNAAKDRLLSIVAHDLRGPFTGFIGLSKALATQLDTLSKEEISEFGSAIYITAKKLNDLLNNLLEWSRLQSGKVYFEPTEFLLFREVENIRDLFSSAVSDKSINIINEVELNTAVYADKKMLSTVLGNLTSNAIKFTPSGGKITISAKAEDNFVRVSVSDTGIGMTEEKLAKAFKIDSVFTTKGTNGETGTVFVLLLCKEMF